MEREKFENEFRDAFREAEQSPSESVWVNVELELERAEGKKMKRRVLFYKMLAAASVTFALMITGAGILFLSNSESGNTTAIASSELADGQDSKADLRGGVPRKSDDAIDRRDPSGSGDITGDGDNRDEDRAASDPETNDNPSASYPQQSTINRPEGSGNARGDVPQRGQLLAENNSTPSDALHPDKTVDQNAKSGGISQRGTQPGSPENLFDRFADLTRANGGVETANPAKAETTDEVIPKSANGEAGITGNELIASGTAIEETAPESAEVVPGTSADRNANEPENAPSSEPDAVALMFAKLNDLEKELAEQGAGGKKAKKNSPGEKMWTSVGFAAGGYNGQATAPVQANAMALNSAVEQQAEASGVAYSLNISMGTRIANRVVLQGGLSYMNNSTSYTSNQVVRSENMDFKPATINDLRAAGSSLFNNNTVIPTAPHSVNNNMEFISIPVQAGYIVIDRRFGLQLNAGVATDFFIQNTIDPQGSDLKATTQDRGAESPYRSTNFSGLMGTEFSYRLGDKYRVALNPGLRYPLNSIYKEETGIESTPLTFDVGLRFRYIFR